MIAGVGVFSFLYIEKQIIIIRRIPAIIRSREGLFLFLEVEGIVINM